MTDYVRLTLTVRQAEALAALAEASDIAVVCHGRQDSFDEQEKRMVAGHTARKKLRAALAKATKAQAARA